MQVLPGTQEEYDRLKKVYELDHMRRTLWIEQHTEKDDVLLDFGGGYGHLEKYLSREYYLYEPSEDRALLSGCQLVNDPFDGNWNFDAVIMTHVLEHISGDYEVLLKLRGITDKLLIEVPNWDALAYDLAPALRQHEMNNKYHVQHYTPATLAHTLYSAGWSNKRIETIQRYSLQNTHMWWGVGEGQDNPSMVGGDGVLPFFGKLDKTIWWGERGDTILIIAEKR